MSDRNWLADAHLDLMEVEHEHTMKHMAVEHRVQLHIMALWTAVALLSLIVVMLWVRVA